MKILVDNLDGSGSVDYTPFVQFGKETVIVRLLNKPTLCTFLFVAESGFVTPVQNARVEVNNCSGALLFTGYVTGCPVIHVVGEQEQGPLFTVAITAISDEVLLDTSPFSTGTMLLGQSAQQSWNTLAALSSATPFLSLLAEQLPTSSRLSVEAGARWSETAGTLANNTRSTYRCVSRTVEVASIGQTIHPITACDPGLQFTSLNIADLHWLANDITVVGHEEPKAYVTEVFQGDGSTASFTLSGKPFTRVSHYKTSITDLFQGTSLNPRTWTIIDPGAHVALTAEGLTCTGGTGKEAESIVASLQQVELGGTTTLEGGGVRIAAGSEGTILGLYTGSVNQANCFAGFFISNTDNSLNVSPVIGGLISSSNFPLLLGHLYTFRLRVLSPEMERIQQSYCYQTEYSSNTNGGKIIASEGLLEFELQDVTSGTPTAPTILFSGPVSTIPPTCVLGLLDSGNLDISIKSIQCTQSGPLWVSVGAIGSTPVTQFMGTAFENSACHVTSAGNLTFYPGNIPPTGALIYATYRLQGRAVARRAVAPSTGNTPALPAKTWIGTVKYPATWSSVDCDNAAAALIDIASSTSVAMKGTYVGHTLRSGVDIWPGDSLLIGPLLNGLSTTVTVREVRIEFFGGLPTLPLYIVHFANDWAESISIKVSSKVPSDAFIPQQLTTVSTALQSLSGLTIKNVTNTTLSINTGLVAPINGGFEIRRREETFGPGIDSDLVLRSSSSNISIPRTAAIEQYYVRMYDGATPPNYSLFSSAVFINVPL